MDSVWKVLALLTLEQNGAASSITRASRAGTGLALMPLALHAGDV